MSDNKYKTPDLYGGLHLVSLAPRGQFAQCPSIDSLLGMMMFGNKTALSHLPMSAENLAKLKEHLKICENCQEMMQYIKEIMFLAEPINGPMQ